MLLIRLLLVPLLVVLLTLAGRRWGPAVAGWLTGFPIVAGPILLLIALEQGPAFASHAALWSLSVVLANVCFGIAYSWAARRLPWWICLVAGSVGFAAGALALSWRPLPPWPALALTLAGLWLAPRAFPRVQAGTPLPPSTGSELLARMLAGAAMVAAVTFLAQRLGPHVSGILTVYPVMSLVLAVFSHRQAGPAHAIRLLGGVVGGLYAFSAFCFTVGMALPLLGIAPGFILALVCALAVQAVTFCIRHPQLLAGWRRR
jgi:hypothetical protein